MKAQLIPFVFLVLLIGGALLGYIYYNTFYGLGYEKSVYEINILDILRNEIEGLKGYSKQALIYSSHQALREHACLGGLIGAGPWICNGPNTYSPSDSKRCLEKYTKYYLNIYFGNYSVLDLPVQLTKRNFSSLIYQVDPNKVLNGDYDEGNFWVNVSGAMATISGKSATITTNLNISEYITRNRFWYLWRIFYEWAQDDIYTKCICSHIGCACSSTSGEEACTSCKDDSEYCANLSLMDLQRRFNGTEVKCYRNKPYTCCAQGIGPISCTKPNTYNCLTWTNSPCLANCMHKCEFPPPSTPVCPAISGSYTTSSSTSSTTYQQAYNENTVFTQNFYSSPFLIFSFSPSLSASYSYCSNYKCKYYVEARFASAHQFTCVDHKYYVPSNYGPVPLVFRVNAIAFLRVPALCEKEVSCTGSSSTGCSCPNCPSNTCR